MDRRIIVFSDSHNHTHTLYEIMRRHHKADYFIHLGDGARDVADLREAFPEKRILFVKGNCDLYIDERAEDVLDCGAVRIFFTHGHRYDVKRGYDRILARAKELNAQIALFGHTHESLCLFRDGIHLLNPGSTDQPRDGEASYGVVDLTPAGIVARIVEL